MRRDALLYGFSGLGVAQKGSNAYRPSFEEIENSQGGNGSSQTTYNQADYNPKVTVTVTEDGRSTTISTPGAEYQEQQQKAMQQQQQQQQQQQKTIEMLEEQVQQQEETIQEQRKELSELKKDDWWPDAYDGDTPEDTATGTTLHPAVTPKSSFNSKKLLGIAAAAILLFVAAYDDGK